MKIGQFNDLTVVKEVPFGLYLDGRGWGEILLPKKYVPKGTQTGDKVRVFVYFDSEDKIIATTQQPYACVESFALLRVIDVNSVGAFVNWGLDKDLLVPRAEQKQAMEKGKSYIVYLRQDNRGRIIGSSKLDYYLDKIPAEYTSGEEVDLLVAEISPLGRKVIINNKHWGLVYTADIFQPLHYGKTLRGYIKTLRDDGKIDVVLGKSGQEHVHQLAQKILEKLQKSGGFIPLHDKSSPQDIQRVFGESKKSFKNAIGQLYKQKVIIIEAEGIRLLSWLPGQ